MSFYWPTDPSQITEEAGTRGGNHWGIDFGVPIGTPLIAPFSGTVAWIGNDGASGFLPGTNIKANGPALILDIRRDDGLISRFAHLNGYNVKAGQRVNAGDVVAYSGNTGFSTGPHLHWEIRWSREFSQRGWVNPRSFNPQIFENKPQRKGQPMFDVYWTGPNPSKTQVSGRLITAYGSYWIPSMQIYTILLRRKNAALNPGASDNMLDAEHDILNNYLRACFQSALTGIQLDPAKLRSALTDALKAAGTNIKVDANTEVPVDKLAAAFEAATPRIVAALMKQAGQKLAS